MVTEAIVAVAGLETAVGDVDFNLAKAELALREAAGRGAEIVVLPELTPSGYTTDTSALYAMRGRLESVVPSWQALASELGIALVAGLPRFVGDGVFNAAVAIDSDGSVAGWYHKLHLFAGERDAFVPGDLGLPIVRLCGLRVGILICYDLRFVEAMRVLALAGADVIVVPTAWTPGFDEPPKPDEPMITQLHGAVMQANLNQVTVACAGMSGSSTSDVRLLGRSAIVNRAGSLARRSRSGGSAGRPGHDRRPGRTAVFPPQDSGDQPA